MALRDTVAQVVDSVAERVALRLAAHLQERQAADLTVEWITRGEDIAGIRYPASYVAFMRKWHEESRWDVREVKRVANAERDGARRFVTFVDELRSHVPVPPLSIARTAAHAADMLLDKREALNFGDWAGDVGLHFRISSSLARKGRMLCAAIRFLRPGSVLELGTAYGMSSLFMGLARDSLPGSWSITTVEQEDQSHALAAAVLAEALGNRVTCLKGTSQETLEQLRTTHARFDFFFHDAAHSMNAYVSDFEAAEPMLEPGTVCLIDDIRWEDERFHAGGARTYDGWLHIVGHPRTIMAAELDQSIGLILLQ